MIALRDAPASKVSAHFQPGRRTEAAIRFLLALGLAAGLCLAVRHAIPTQLAVRTDIVGYPTWANYNIERVLDEYYLLVAGFPFAAFVLYVTLGLASWRLGLRSTAAVQPGLLLDLDNAPGLGQHAPAVGATLRLLAVGFGFGLELAMATGAAGPALLGILIAVPAVYGALVMGALPAARRLRAASGGLSSPAALNALLAPVGVLGIAWVAAATTSPCSPMGRCTDTRGCPAGRALR